MTSLNACFLKSFLGRLNGLKHEAPGPNLTPLFPRTVPQVTYPLVFLQPLPQTLYNLRSLNVDVKINFGKFNFRATFGTPAMQGLDSHLDNFLKTTAGWTAVHGLRAGSGWEISNAHAEGARRALNRSPRSPWPTQRISACPGSGERLRSRGCGGRVSPYPTSAHCGLGTRLEVLPRGNA